MLDYTLVKTSIVERFFSNKKRYILRFIVLFTTYLLVRHFVILISLHGSYNDVSLEIPVMYVALKRF
jgi:hypothetical protein